MDIDTARTDDNNIHYSSPENQAAEDNQVIRIKSIMPNEVNNLENSSKIIGNLLFSGDEQAEGIGKVHKVEENSMDTASEDDARRTESKQPGLDDNASDKTSGKENEDENGKDSEDSKANITMLKAKEEHSSQGTT